MTTTKSEARMIAEAMGLFDGTPLGLIYVPTPCSVSHQNYSVAYFDDNSILICAMDEEPIVLDDQRTYYRDTVEHLARCLGCISKAKRASSISGDGEYPVELSGIRWNRDGSFHSLT